MCIGRWVNGEGIEDFMKKPRKVFGFVTIRINELNLLDGKESKFLVLIDGS